MNRLKRWLLNRSNLENQISVPQPVEKTESITQTEKTIRFTVYSANGGRVIETYRYDRKTDRNQNNLYIITNDQEFGKEIDKIITMEALRS